MYRKEKKLLYCVVNVLNSNVIVKFRGNFHAAWRGATQHENSLSPPGYTSFETWRERTDPP